MNEETAKWEKNLEGQNQNQEVSLLDSRSQDESCLDPQTVQGPKALLLRLEQERQSIRMK